MAYNFDGTSEFFTLGSMPVTAPPFTVVGWGQPDSELSFNVMFSIEQPNDGHTLEWRGDVTNDPIRAYSVEGGVADAFSDKTNYANGVWAHAAGVWGSTASRTAYLDGAAGTENTSTITPGTLNASYIAKRSIFGDAFFNGKLAEMAVWNIALTTEQIAILAARYSPLFVRIQSLVFHAPLIREAIDIVGGTTLTATGTPDVFTHPRIIDPSAQILPYPTPAVGGQSIVPLIVNLHGAVA